MRGEPHPITGNLVFARIKLSTDESLARVRKRMHEFCKDKLARFIIPQKVELVASAMHGERFQENEKTMSGAPPGPAAWVLREVRPDDSAGLDTISDLHMELLGFGPMASGWGPPVFSNLSIKRH